MKKKSKIIIAIAAALGMAVVAAVSLRYYNAHKRNVIEPVTVSIREGESYNNLLLEFEGRLKDYNSFARCAGRESMKEHLTPGRYKFAKGTSNIEIIRAIRFGWESPVNLTLSGNIRTIKRLSAILGKQLMYDSTAFVSYLKSEKAISESGFDSASYLSLFIPDTYSVYWTITPEEFLQRMKREYAKFWNEERVKKADELGLSPGEVSVLASIVCEESNYLPELARIAGVYINRLKKGMRLEADPTVKFALNDPSIKRILYKHLEIDSPYNTYKHTGLPPGPITIPQPSGIDAVLNYEKHNYLYFCASDKLDGTHFFATSLSQHNANAKKYQRAISAIAR